MFREKLVILVTGGCGFVWFYVVRCRLFSEGCTVMGIGWVS